MQARAYVHPELNREVFSGAGHYLLTREVRLPFRGREVLVVVGYAVLDTSCCGVGGFSYALVPGFVLRWKEHRTQGGQPVSLVEPVEDADLQEEIRSLIRRAESIHQVQFG